jgi:hypothetical protein
MYELLTCLQEPRFRLETSSYRSPHTLKHIWRSCAKLFAAIASLTNRPNNFAFDFGSHS